MGDDERLPQMETHLERFPPLAGLEPWTALSVGQRLTY